MEENIRTVLDGRSQTLPKATFLTYIVLPNSKPTHPSAANAHGVLGKPLLGLQGLGPLVPQPLIIFEELHQLLGLLPHIHAMVFPILHILKVLQGLNGKNVLFALLGDLR